MLYTAYKAVPQDVGIAFMQTPELPLKHLSCVPCVWKGRRVCGEEGLHGAWACVIE